MIELNKETQQDFLNREWVQKLLDAGVGMSDAKYYISNLGYIVSKDYKINIEQRITNYFKKHPDEENKSEVSFIPTYTASEMLYKLYKHNYNVSSFSLCGSYSIMEHLAFLLLQCHKKDIDMKTKDTGNIND